MNNSPSNKKKFSFFTKRKEKVKTHISLSRKKSLLRRPKKIKEFND